MRSSHSFRSRRIGQRHVAHLRLHRSSFPRDGVARSTLQSDDVEILRWLGEILVHNEQAGRRRLHQGDDVAGVWERWRGADVQTRRISENQRIQIGREPDGSTRLPHRVGVDYVDGETWHRHRCVDTGAHQQHLSTKLRANRLRSTIDSDDIGQCARPWLSQNRPRTGATNDAIRRWKIVEFDCGWIGRFSIGARACAGNFPSEIPVFRIKYCCHGLAVRSVVFVDRRFGQSVLTMRKVPPLHEIHPNKAVPFALHPVRRNVFTATKRNRSVNEFEYTYSLSSFCTGKSQYFRFVFTESTKSFAVRWTTLNCWRSPVAQKVGPFHCARTATVTHRSKACQTMPAVIRVRIQHVRTRWTNWVCPFAMSANAAC